MRKNRTMSIFDDMQVKKYHFFVYAELKMKYNNKQSITLDIYIIFII